jgi:hypothetical protein
MTPSLAKTCDLCPAGGPLTRALLREAFSDLRVSITACTPCAARAWRTIEQPAPIQIEALGEWVVFPPISYRFVAEWAA